MKKHAELKEAVDYFKNNQGYSRLFEGICEKYSSLGYLGGSVKLDKLKSEEKIALEGLLKKSFGKKQSASIPISKVEEALIQSRFQEIPLKEILEGYFGQPLSVKREEKEARQLEQEAFFETILSQCLKTSIGHQWLRSVMETKSPPYRTMLQRYKINPNALYMDLINVVKAVEVLPFREGRPERLAVFAAKISGNPHYFDEKTEADRLFTKALIYALGLGKCVISNAEQKAELLYQAGILKDDVSNYTTCYGIQGYRRDGTCHRGMRAYFEDGETMLLTLENINSVNKIEAYDNRVYVVENPTVFSYIKDEMKEKRVSLMCTNGQLRLASIVVLDLLSKSNTCIYYAGDFDPEGIMIAAKLKERYGEKLKLWHYDESDYQMALSNEVIEESRIRKMDRMGCQELMLIKELIVRHKRAGYQENMIRVYLGDF